MTDALDQIWRRRARTLLQQVPMITNRDRLTVVEAFYVADDLSQDTTEPVADWDDTSAIELRITCTWKAKGASLRSLCNDLAA
jgi:hypothetical protein